MKNLIQAAVVTLFAASTAQAQRCAVFARPTDTVQIGSNTSFSGDYTLEWSGFVLDRPVATNPPATWNARIWSEQDSVTEDKTLALNPDRTPVGWVNTPCWAVAAGPSAIPVIQRTHVALVRIGVSRTLYVNGVAVMTSEEPCAPLNGGGSNMTLGAFVYVNQPASNYWRAAPVAIDWIRVSNAARYAGSFDPPLESSLLVDSQTQLLMTFEGPDPWRNLANPSTAISLGTGVSGGTSPNLSSDCNGNGVPDEAELGLPDADRNGNGILDVCEGPIEWKVQDGGNGHWYQAFPAGRFVNWNDADAYSRTIGATLATVTSQQELDFVWRSLASNPRCWKLDMNFSGPMLGGIEINGQWQWVTGEPWGFTKWGSCYLENSEQRLHFGCDSLSTAWNNIHDWETNVGGAIVEWSADCNNDGKVDFGQILAGELPDTNGNGIPDCCENGGTCCIGDIFGDGQVNGGDLGIMLSYWGPVTSAPASKACDLNHDGVIGGADLGLLLANWGPCP